MLRTVRIIESRVSLPSDRLIGRFSIMTLIFSLSTPPLSVPSPNSGGDDGIYRRVIRRNRGVNSEISINATERFRRTPQGRDLFARGSCSSLLFLDIFFTGVLCTFSSGFSLVPLLVSMFSI